jgi:hypothetical protein
MRVRIACIVEGHGESTSVPILIRRIAACFDPELAVDVHAIRVTRSRLLKLGELERAVQFAALRAGTGGGILVIVDSDDDCPAKLAPVLLARIHAARADLPSAIVLAHREFEAWFLAAARSLRGCRGLPDDLEPPLSPQTIRGAKEWLNQRVRTGTYSPNPDQPALTAAFDLDSAKTASSFDKCYREVTKLLALLRERGKL